MLPRSHSLAREAFLADWARRSRRPQVNRVVTRTSRKFSWHLCTNRLSERAMLRVYCNAPPNARCVTCLTISHRTRPGIASPLCDTHSSTHRSSRGSQAGAIGFLGLGMNHVARDVPQAWNTIRSALCGTRALGDLHFSLGRHVEHESFDLKPDAPDAIRGEFRPIATRHAGHRDLRAPARACQA